jgi:hypothetical protein
MADSHPEFITRPNFIQENGFETNSYLYPIREKSTAILWVTGNAFWGTNDYGDLTVSALTRH